MGILKPRILIVAMIILLAFGLSANSANPLIINKLFLDTQKAVFSHPDQLKIASKNLATLSIKECRSNWLLGVALSKIGDITGENNAWERYLQCSTIGKQTVSMLRAVQPQNAVLATSAINHFPREAASYIWLGEITAQQDTNKAIELYNQAVGLDPRDGLTWCHLGSLYYQREMHIASANAYLQCCLNGDPGVNGCWGAGQLMEELGAPNIAIQYYRYSTWQKSQDRADQLENQLVGKQ
ncbi:MAG: hypothetical protein PHQ40_06290 [Anaerolineaceae bacterium]|nr:hypothetical protein [Anaerolineaceae bacterium]